MPSFDLSLLVPLLAAHFLSDFTFQTDSIALHKGKPLYLLLHLLITGSCAYLLVGDFDEWRIPLLLTASHGLIDLAKNALLSSDKRNEFTLFLSDQLAHIGVIFALAAIEWPGDGLLNPWWLGQNPSSYLSTLVFVTAVIATTKATGITISKALPKMLGTDPIQLQANTGLNRAGRYIGYLERLLLLVFVFTNQLAAAGFLIAAKSIFRSPKTDEDRKQTEYILLGTLLSFTLGIAIAFGCKALLPN